MNTTEHGLLSPAPAASPAGSAEENAPADDIDVNFAEESADVNCIRGLVANAERSSQLVDDGMNATEASEERNAASEAQAMR